MTKHLLAILFSFWLVFRGWQHFMSSTRPNSIVQKLFAFCGLPGDGPMIVFGFFLMVVGVMIAGRHIAVLVNDSRRKETT